MSLDAESGSTTDEPLDGADLSAEMTSALGEQTQVEPSPESQGAADASVSTGQPELGGEAAAHAGAGEAQAQATTSFREQLAAAGIPIQGTDDAQALAEIRQIYQALPQIQQMAQQNQQLQAYYAQQQQAAQLQQQAAQMQRGGPQVQPYNGNPTGGAPRGGRPEFDPSWVNLVHTVNGEIVPKNPLTCHPDIPAKVKAYQDWEQATVQHMLDNYRSPEEQQAEIDQRVQAAIQQNLQAFQQQQSQQAQIQQIQSQLGAQLYQMGANGQPVVNPITRQPVYTQYGSEYVGTLQGLIGGDWTNPNFQHQVVELILAGRGITPPGAAPAGQPAASPQQNQQQRLAQQQSQFLGGRLANGAGRTPNRNNAALSAARNGEPEAGDDFAQMLKKAGREQGIYPEKAF